MLMAKKKQGYPKPRRSIVILALIIIALSFVYLVLELQHRHAVKVDKARFVQAEQEVQAVASQIISAVGQPADRKDGGKCSYPHQKFSKGPLSCISHQYLAYGVNGHDAANNITLKITALTKNTAFPWMNSKTTIYPRDNDSRFDSPKKFNALTALFDSETQAMVAENPRNKTMDCGIGLVYHNTLSTVSGYPNLNVSAPQTLLIDINCGKEALSQIYPLED